ncbi:MAG: DNA-binding transcriptional regulator OxyR [Deltaproteobacteria bacterium]|nr:MAG: DNA-binding transcriptional regulator OxyR [Deltaproteobacteria bacterium]
MATITQLEYLLAVDSERHFGKAAQICNVSQPSLSAQIQKLEDELGVVVFDRSKKPILPTEAGVDLLEQARIIIREHKKLTTIADIKAIEPKGDFEMGIIPTLAAYVVPLFISDFAQKYPKVNFGIHEYKTGDIIRMLHKDELDAALLVTPLKEEALIQRHLYYEPFYCYLNQNHSLLEKEALKGEDLKREDLWLLSEGHCFRDQVLNICKENEKGCAIPNIRFESGSLETIIKLVKGCSGYTLLPEMAVDSLSDEEKKRHIRAFSEPVPTREVCLVYTRTFLKETIINALESSIIDNLPANIRSLKRQEIQVVKL